MPTTLPTLSLTRNSQGETQTNEGLARTLQRAGVTWGPSIEADGRVRFRLWAPKHKHISLELAGGHEFIPMQTPRAGWHEVTIPAAYGSLYCFVLPDGSRVPDAASRYQPHDVHGPSELTDRSSYPWRTRLWVGRPWNQAVIYELHVGTFTEAGTFRGAIEKLPHLMALGVTALELMPVADFPGGRNWGYDGVFPYAPDSSYGRPDDLKALVDAAHELGLMVLLDVVYNHFGPDGNYLNAYAPQFFTDRHKTPWGDAINFDGADARPVRDFFIENALYWIEEFQLDGLRFDAVHAIKDDSERHILDEIATCIHQRVPHRHVHLLLENEENQARWLERGKGGRANRYTAQWNDDVHHVLHTAATGENSGYYQDYLGDDHKLGRALAEGFAFQGEHMQFRGSARGEPCAHLPPQAFVAFIQNHDQIGNRAFGERLTEIATAEAVRAVAAVYLLMPQIPMLFMGEEWGAAEPFPFFCDFEGELAEAVRNGRRAEFARFPEFEDPQQRERIPDPQAVTTFTSAKLRWDALASAVPRASIDWYRRILSVRHEEIVPRLNSMGGCAAEYEILGPSALTVRWRVGANEILTLCANLCHNPVEGISLPPGRILWQEGDPGDGTSLKPWTVYWTLMVTEPHVER
jgi:malto-oligosyltrehalose trehalohydrolase